MASQTNNCDVSDCCGDICDEFTRIEGEMENAIEQSWANIEPLRDIVNEHQGVFVETPAGWLPTLAETTGRIHNLGGGFAEWSFFEFRTTNDRVTVNLPAAITDPTKAAVSLNAARLTAPRDYSISGSVLTLVYPLEHRDWIVVKTYGA